MVRIAVLVSGGGTNLQALIDAEKCGKIPSGKIELVVASRPDAFALERAKTAGISSCVVSRRDYSDAKAYDFALNDALKSHGIEFVVLAGFLSILGRDFIAAFSERIINVHPSLIPSFCGKGHYGLKVHEEAISRGVKVTGATVHIVNEEPDGGRIIFQKAVEVLADDTAETLQQRVMEQAEWQLLPRAVELCCKGLTNT